MARKKPVGRLMSDVLWMEALQLVEGTQMELWWERMKRSRPLEARQLIETSVRLRKEMEAELFRNPSIEVAKVLGTVRLSLEIWIETLRQEYSWLKGYGNQDVIKGRLAYVAKRLNDIFAVEPVMTAEKPEKPPEQQKKGA